MRLNNRRGITAMVDAMIFIIILGIAVSAMFSLSGGDLKENDASSISDIVFSSKLRACDLIDTEESGLISMPDIIAFRILTGEGCATEYIEGILDSLMKRPGSFSLDIDYQGNTIKIGSGKGDAISGSVKEYTVTYGGSVRADLRFY
ncbi:MAG: hypothetical protein FWG60_01800 [Methanomassiliicoccaceae archaeon]|nr:hypothetical protein [Methanomassiliicoccaceae archaeon]